MTKRTPISVQKPIWYDAQQVDETDLTSEQITNDVITSSIINNHIGDGILPETLVDNVLFDSVLVSGYLDGKPIQTQAQPSDNNFGNQLSISLSNSKVSGHRTAKVCIIGLDFQSNLQYETFYFKKNETQITKKHFTKILVLLFNDILGDPALSFNIGGNLIITEANPMSVSRSPIMVAQDEQPNLFFRDFFLDFSVSYLSLQAMLQAALPFYNVDSLNITTAPLDNLPLISGDVTTQIGQKFQAITNNIQKVTLLLSVRNLVTGQQNDLAWNGDIVLSIYPLQTVIDCPIDIAPNLQIDFSPSNIPLSQVSFNYATLEAAGILLDSVPQPVDFIFSNSPIANGNVLALNQYYAISLKRSGAANKCDILIATGNDLVNNSRITTFTGSLWVDIPDQDLWFKVWTDAAKISDGQAYDAGHGIVITKTALDLVTQSTVDYVLDSQYFIGNDTFRAVLSAETEKSAPVPDQRTGNPIESRQQYVPQINLMNTIDLTNLEKASEPLILGSISDRNIKFFDSSQATINSKLYSASIINDEMLIRIVDDPTDTYRFDTSVTALISSLLNGDLTGARILTNSNNSFTYYRIAGAKLCSMILGDVDGNGIIDEHDLDLLNSYIGYNLNIGLPTHTAITTDGSTTTFNNGYKTLTQSFADLFSVNFQLVNPSNNTVVASGNDGVLVANPSDPRLAQFTSVVVNFNNIIGLSDYKLVVLDGYVNEANYGGWDITSLDSITDILTIRKIYLTGDTIAQMFRSDINGDFVINTADGYLLNNYIEKQPTSTSPTVTYPAPASNPYTKIGTRFNIIRLRLEKFIDRNDDYISNPNIRNNTIHQLQDIFLSDGYFSSHDYSAYPVGITISKQLIWDESLIVSSSSSRLVPVTFTSLSETNYNACDIEGIQCNVYPVTNSSNSGRVDFFVPSNLIIGKGGELQRPDGNFYKVDFEVGTIVLEIPDGLFGSERTIDIMSDFIVDHSGNGATRVGFPSMKFADCSFVTADAITNDQLRFSVSVQSFSPNTNGLSPDGYYGAIVDGKMGVSIDFATGLLTLNFTNLFQDVILETLSTKIQVTVYLKKGGFNNQPLFVDANKVQNMLSLISVFSGANDGGPSALVDLQNDTTGILPIVHGGLGLNHVGATGTVLTSTGSGVSYQFVNDLIGVISYSTGISSANQIPKLDGYGFLDPSFMYKNPIYINAVAGTYAHDGYVPLAIGAFTFRFDKYILEGLESIKLECILETTNVANTAGIQIFNINTHTYLNLTGSSSSLSTTNTSATYLTSQDLKSILSTGATNFVYEIHLNLSPGSVSDTAICKMARIVMTYNNLSVNGSSIIAPPVAHSYNFAPFLPSPTPI